MALATGQRPPRDEDEELKLIRGSQLLAAVLKLERMPNQFGKHLDDIRPHKTWDKELWDDWHRRRRERMKLA